ncbi:MAG TPA: hypothetical protein VHA80_11835 [Solirubrobacterales bacterium]|nr:hypothetical protein [Solirubrobacterales bacterium]
MPPNTRSRTRAGTRDDKAAAALLNRREAAFLADVPLRAVDKAIEEKVT